MRFSAAIVIVALAASSAAGAEIDYSTYLGGSDDDFPNALEVNDSGREIGRAHV